MFRYIVSIFVLITLEKNLKRRGRKGGGNASRLKEPCTVQL